MTDEIGVTYDDELRTPHYVNGRLLSAEDLAADQAAVLERLASLGKGVGYGVINGLWVYRAGSTSVRIQPGMGINRQGDLVRLEGDAVILAVNVEPEEEEAELEDGGRFQRCQDGPSTSAGVSATGAYVLVARPTSKLVGQVPVQSVAGRKTAECASKWAVEGVKFRAVRLKDFPVIANEHRHKTRSRLAHWCYGSAKLRTLVQYPFTFKGSYSNLDLVSGLTDCDLPLAVFYWTPSGIDFADVWSVRRRLIHRSPYPDWSPLMSDKRRAEGEARFLQFQHQLATLPAPATAKASTYFPFLPPVGFLPIRPDQRLIARMITRLVSALRARIPDLQMETEQLTQVVTTQVNEILDDTLWTGTFDIDTFFDGFMVEFVALADRYPIEVSLNNSWFGQAIDLAQQPTVSLYILYEDLMLLITSAFLQGLQLETAQAIGLVRAEIVEEARPRAAAAGETLLPRRRALFDAGTREAALGGVLATRARREVAWSIPVSESIANELEIGWGMTDPEIAYNQPPAIVTTLPEQPQLELAWTIVIDAVSDFLGRDPVVVDFGIMAYNQVRLYAMFQQSEADLDIVQWGRT